MYIFKCILISLSKAIEILLIFNQEVNKILAVYIFKKVEKISIMIPP